MDKILRVDGTVDFIEPKNGTDYSLDELKEFIGGGWIETVALPDGNYAICDEEGKLKNFKYNTIANELYAKALIPGDYFAGDIAIIDKNKIK